MKLAQDPEYENVLALNANYRYKRPSMSDTDFTDTPATDSAPESTPAPTEPASDIPGDLPLYACHKQVRAAKIKRIRMLVIPHMNIEDRPDGLVLDVDGEEKEVDVTEEWINRHGPEPGGFFVQYADGYQSYSPAEPFESGYTRV